MVIIRTEGESAIAALSRRVGEKLKEAGVKTMHNKSPAHDSRSAGHADSGVRIVEEKVRMLICFARELHGVTVGKSHVSLPWCVRFAAQIINRSHSGTDGMTGELFFREAFAEFQKRILEMVCCSTASKEPRANYNLELKEGS